MTPRTVPPALAAVALALLARAAGPRLAGENLPPVPQPPETAQLSVAAVPTPPPAPTAPPNEAPMSALDELVAPIALYPDPLVAIILPASTAPWQIANAQVYLAQVADRSQIDSQPWDPSVRALAHYPSILSWLSDNPAWTQALGKAFLGSPADVMSAIQHVRARALADGILVSTPEQRVFSDNGEIEILPAQAEYIFVPAYDADALFQPGPVSAFGDAAVNYGPACDVGPWLSCCIDWDGGAIWVGGWGAWHGPAGWYRPHFSGTHGPVGAQPWHPVGLTVIPLPPEQGTRSTPFPHPRPIQGAPAAENPPARSAGQPEARTGAVDPVPGADDRRYAAPEGNREAAPPAARAQTAAPAAHAAPAQSAPAASHESAPAPAAASADPKNH
jgi:Protein of unknown function (DUF3300)